MDESNADFFDTRMAPSGLADCRLFCSKKNVEPAVPDPNWIGKWSPEWKGDELEDLMEDPTSEVMQDGRI